MLKRLLFFFTAMSLTVVILLAAQTVFSKAEAQTPEVTPTPAAEAAGAESSPAANASVDPALAGNAIFRNPVVPGSVISCYFDHNPANTYVTYYNGLQNASPSYGYYFGCNNPSMWDFVGCADNVSGESACPNNRELWYDNHKGTDYEYAANWHTGASCDPNRFSGITKPVYAPARGLVFMAGYDPNRPANGWHIRMKHDLNGNGNWDDDNFRSVYLHFTANALAVYPGQIVEEGQYLGLGGSTGYSSSPHLHFEVQRSADYFQTTYWSVDPHGWQGSYTDPWPYANVSLWQNTNQNKFRAFIPMAAQGQSGCTNCTVQLIKNSGFESGQVNWNVQGVDVITSTSSTNLKVTPYKGSWLSWLAGRNYATDILTQDIAIPTGAPYATFKYYLRMDTAEVGGVYDKMTINLRDTNGNLIRQLDYIDNTFATTGQWVVRTVNMTDLKPWEGKTVRVSFEASSDSNTITSFYVDEVTWVSGPAQ